MITVTIPVKTYSVLNGSQGNWRKASAIRKRIRTAAYLVAAPAQGQSLPVTVRMSRLSAGVLDDDNLRGALKSVRDGIADRLGVPDNDVRVKWEYSQAKCRRGEYGVVVEFVGEGDQ